jgi:transcriptional regulator GlxA family with amidase domain
MLRFNRALDALQAGQRDLAGVALAAGYYDQAHFNRDFRAFAGESPGRWLAGR